MAPMFLLEINLAWKVYTEGENHRIFTMKRGLIIFTTILYTTISHGGSKDFPYCETTGLNYKSGEISSVNLRCYTGNDIKQWNPCSTNDDRLYHIRENEETALRAKGDDALKAAKEIGRAHV